MDKRVDGRSISHDSVGGGCVMAATDKIVTIDRDGKLKDELNLSDKTHSIMSVCAVGTKIWYGDKDKNSVHCIIREGKKSTALTTYRDENLKRPFGICSDNHGSIYVAGCGSDNVHQLTSEGKLERILLSKEDGINCPRVVAFQEDSSDTFLVSDNNTRVRIYKLT